jgi:hypothetical protein
MDSLDFLILIPNLYILWINLDLQIFIKSNSVYSSLLQGRERSSDGVENTHQLVDEHC